MASQKQTNSSRNSRGQSAPKRPKNDPQVRRARQKRADTGFTIITILALILCIVIVITFVVVLLSRTGKSETTELYTTDTNTATTASFVETETTTTVATEPPIVYPTVAEDCFALTENNVTCEYALLYDVTNNEIIAERNADAQIYPASMTKVMTLLVAAENIDDLSDTFTMTYEIIAPLVEEEASRAGFSEGETVTITDLLYGIALPSGADATVAIAEYICGGEDAFVELMNEKAAELGMENTHFTNTSGLHDVEHYTTATDMAILMTAAMENTVCREILGTYQYRTSITEEHPEGILLESTMYSRMYGTEVEGMEIIGGKTGYTDEAMHCLVSYATDNTTGDAYVVVVAYDTTYWRAVFDTFAIYGLVSGGYEMPTDLAGEEIEEAEEEIVQE